MSLNLAKKSQGFSLLEALIAATIFSLILMVSSNAFQFFMQVGARPINSKMVLSQTIDMLNIRDSIKSLHYYYTPSSTLNNAPSTLFFSGNSKAFTGITINSINFKDKPTRLVVSVGDNIAGESSLTYCEHDLSKEYPSIRIKKGCDNPKYLATNISDVQFKYFGWRSMDALQGISNGQPDSEWSTTWSGDKRKILPEFIHISFRRQNEDSYLPTQFWFKLADADPVQIKNNSILNE